MNQSEAEIYSKGIKHLPVGLKTALGGNRGSNSTESGGINAADDTWSHSSLWVKTWQGGGGEQLRCLRLSTENSSLKNRDGKIVHIVLNTHTFTHWRECTDAPLLTPSLDCVLSGVRWSSQAAAVQRRGCCCYNRPGVRLRLLHQRWNWRWKTEQRLKSLLKASGKFLMCTWTLTPPPPPSAAQPINSWCLRSLSCCRPQFPRQRSSDWCGSARITFLIYDPNPRALFWKQPC